MTSKRPASATQRRSSWHATVADPQQSEQAASQHDLKRRNHEQIECAQFLKMKHKLVAKPTDAYAQIRLIHRQDNATRKRSLHRNGSGHIKPSASNSPLHSQPPCAQVRPHTARDPPAAQPADTTTRRRERPQSAKPRTVERETLVNGQQISVALLERTNYYNPIPLTTHLAASRSAPRLQVALKCSNPTRRSASQTTISEPAARPGSQRTIAFQPTLFTEEKEDTPGRRHFVVHMQRMVLTDEDDDVDVEIEVTRPRASGPARQSARSSRMDSDDRSCFIPQRHAWQD